MANWRSLPARRIAVATRDKKQRAVLRGRPFFFGCRRTVGARAAGDGQQRHGERPCTSDADRPQASGDEAEDRRDDQEAGVAERGDRGDADAGGTPGVRPAALKATGTILAAPMPTRAKPTAPRRAARARRAASAMPTAISSPPPTRMVCVAEAGDDRVAGQPADGHGEEKTAKPLAAAAALALLDGREDRARSSR